MRYRVGFCIKAQQSMQKRASKGAVPCQASMSTAGAQTSSRVEEMFKMMDESNSSQGECKSQMLYEGRID